jgi:hypothetical protein
LPEAIASLLAALVLTAVRSFNWRAILTTGRDV